MKLSVSLNTKAIKNAVKALKTAKEQLAVKMVDELLKACCERIKSLANNNVAMLEIGANVKSGIQSSWTIEPTGNGYVLRNTWHKPHGKFEMAAAYVEFGAGIVGGEKPHPEAAETGYQYNVPSSSKDEDGVWGFYTNVADLDLPGGNYLVEKRYGKGGDSRGRMIVSTQGTQATRFLYNAVMDFASDKEAETIWQEIKSKYWG